jgi:hypothetical protein
MCLLFLSSTCALPPSPHPYICVSISSFPLPRHLYKLYPPTCVSPLYLSPVGVSPLPFPCLCLLSPYPPNFVSPLPPSSISPSPSVSHHLSVYLCVCPPPPVSLLCISSHLRVSPLNLLPCVSLVYIRPPFCLSFFIPLPVCLSSLYPPACMFPPSLTLT